MKETDFCAEGLQYLLDNNIPTVKLSDECEHDWRYEGQLGTRHYYRCIKCDTLKAIPRKPSWWGDFLEKHPRIYAQECIKYIENSIQIKLTPKDKKILSSIFPKYANKKYHIYHIIDNEN